MTPPTTEPAAERKPRGPLTLNRPVKLALEGATLAKATRSPQVHVLAAGETTTLCAIDTTKWAQPDQVADDAKVTCPLCARQMKQAAKDAAEVADIDAILATAEPAKPKKA
jgi:hypothetical protein